MDGEIHPSGSTANAQTNALNALNKGVEKRKSDDLARMVHCYNSTLALSKSIPKPCYKQYTGIFKIDTEMTCYRQHTGVLKIDTEIVVSLS
jgi:hypothetical protein